MPFRHKLTTFVFSALLLLPVLDQVLSLSGRFGNTENRQLTSVPTLHFPYVRQFIRQFDQYYRENFGWRNALFYGYSRWKLNILGESPLPEKLIVGKQGWFYLGNSFSHVIDQHRGLQPLSADSARCIAAHLVQRQQELARRGIRFYVLIVPDSHTIYPEYLPDNLQVDPFLSRLDVLKKAVLQTSLPFVDIRDMLLVAKRSHVVYNQTDSHWNNYGTLIGCAALLDRIRIDFPDMIPFRLSNYQVKQQRGIGGDLVRLVMAQKEIEDPVFYSIDLGFDLTARQTASIPNEISGFPSTRFSGNGYHRVVLIGDSFSHSMMQYLPGYFQDSYFIRGYQLSTALPKTERPDILVLEVVERDINRLARF